MPEHEWKEGDGALLPVRIGKPWRGSGEWKTWAYFGDQVIGSVPVSALRPAPPEPAEGGPFRVRCGAGSDWWVLAVDGVGNNGSVTISSTDNEAAADVFPAQWRPVFAAEPDRFEVVDVEPERNPQEVALEIATQALDRIVDPYGPGYSLIVEMAKAARARIAALTGK